MMGGYILVSVLAVTISASLSDPTPLDQLTINLNLDDSPKGKFVGQSHDGGLWEKGNEEEKQKAVCVADNGQACMFPFCYPCYNFDRQIHQRCTKVGHNRYWCATKKSHSGDWWGNCPDSCEHPDAEEEEEEEEGDIISINNEKKIGNISLGYGNISNNTRNNNEAVEEPEYSGPDAVSAVSMPNIGYIFKGYDILKGNPLHISGLTIDPGFKQHIFKASFEEGKKTSDQRYLQPDGTSLLSCTACSIFFSSTEISGPKSYQDNLKERVSCSVGSCGGYEAAFSASAGYKEVAQKSSQSSLFILSSADCCAYAVKTLFLEHPPFDEHFLAAMETLTEKYDEKEYMKFIETFGTHFISEAVMGSLYGQQTQISKDAWTTMLENGVDIRGSASLSALGAVVSTDVMNKEDQEKAESFSTKTTGQKTFVIGKAPTADDKIETWIENAMSAAAPIGLRITSIMDLLNVPYGIEVSDAIKENLQKGLNNYCDHLAKLKMVETCSAPGPDHPFPSPPVPI